MPSLLRRTFRTRPTRSPAPLYPELTSSFPPQTDFTRSKFQQFLASPENIPTNVLSNRLKMLESKGLIKATFYQRHPPRFAYTLTEKGKKLAPVIRAIGNWGESNIRNFREKGRALST